MKTNFEMWFEQLKAGAKIAGYGDIAVQNMVADDYRQLWEEGEHPSDVIAEEMRANYSTDAAD